MEVQISLNAVTYGVYSRIRETSKIAPYAITAPISEATRI